MEQVGDMKFIDFEDALGRDLILHHIVWQYVVLHA